MISLSALSTLVWVALVMTSATPLILMTLLVRDWLRGNLW